MASKTQPTTAKEQTNSKASSKASSKKTAESKDSNSVNLNKSGAVKKNTETDVKDEKTKAGRPSKKIDTVSDSETMPAVEAPVVTAKAAAPVVVEQPESDFSDEVKILDAHGKEVDLARVFVCKKDTAFLLLSVHENGKDVVKPSIRVASDNTKIQRVDEFIYSISGVLTENNSPFTIPFECIDKEEADELWDELCDYETNPEKYHLAPDPAEQPQHITNDQLNAATTPPPATSATQQQETFANVPITNVNIDDLIKKLPPTAPKQEIPMTSVSLGTPSDISHIIHNQQSAELQAYANSVGDHINNSWKVSAWGGLPLDEARDFINNQCSKDYTYDFRKDDLGHFLIIRKGSVEVRVPKIETEYLKII